MAGGVAQRSVSRGAERWMGAIGFCLLMMLAAHVRVPLPGTPVPMTMQSTVVILAGFALTPAAAMMSMLMYLMIGLAGLPIFTTSAGLWGVTGGYLAGFVLAAGITSFIRGRAVGWGRLSAAGAAGTILVLISGACWQVVFFDLTMADALRFGVWPFLPKAAVQLGVAVAAFRAIRSLYSVRDDGNVI